MLVIELNGVAVEAMFDANTLQPPLGVADDFARELPVDLPGAQGHVASQEPHHIGAGKGADGMMHQAGVETGQTVRVLEHDIRGVFALRGAPIIF